MTMTMYRNEASNSRRTSSNRIAMKAALVLCYISSTSTAGFTPVSVLSPPRSSPSLSVGVKCSELQADQRNRRVTNSHLQLSPQKDDNENDEAASQQLPIQITAGSLGLATAAALVLFFNSGSAMAPDALQAQAATATTTESSSFVFAKASAPPKQQLQNVPPPPITSTSTPQALQIARDLVSLDAKMYGAYWCSHCNDQKQIMGREAMQLVTYVECAKEGKDSRKDLCKARDVPGFPTWDIGGKLYPGEWGLDELEEIVGKAMKKEGR